MSGGTIAQGSFEEDERGLKNFLGRRGTARVFEIDPNTVLGWLVEADVKICQVQLDELYAVLSAVKEGEVSETEAVDRL